MEFDYRLWSFIVSALNLVVVLVAFLTIKFNDLKHVELDLQDIKKSLKETNDKVNCIDKKLAVQNQRIDNLEKK